MWRVPFSLSSPQPNRTCAAKCAAAARLRNDRAALILLRRPALFLVVQAERGCLRDEAVGEDGAREEKRHSGAPELERGPHVAHAWEVKSLAAQVEAAFGKIAAVQENPPSGAVARERGVNALDQPRKLRVAQPQQHDVAVRKAAGERAAHRNHMNRGEVWQHRQQHGARAHRSVPVGISRAPAERDFIPAPRAGDLAGKGHIPRAEDDGGVKSICQQPHRMLRGFRAARARRKQREKNKHARECATIPGGVHRENVRADVKTRALLEAQHFRPMRKLRASPARDAHLRAVGDPRQQVAPAAARLRQPLAGDADDFAAPDSRRDVHAQRRSGRPRERLDTALGCAPGIDAQVAPEVRAARFEAKMRQKPRPHLHEATGERLIARDAEARAGRGVCRDFERVGFRAVRVRRVVDGDLQGDAAEQLLDAQPRVIGDVALDLRGGAGRRGGGGFFRVGRLAVVGAAAGGIAEDFVRVVQLLEARGGLGGAGMQVGMVALCQQAIRRANLRGGAAAVEAERGIVIRFGRGQSS